MPLFIKPQRSRVWKKCVKICDAECGCGQCKVETYLRAQKAREDVAHLVDLSDDPRFGLVGGKLVLDPSNEEEAN